MLRYEYRTQPLLSRRLFLARMVRHGLFAVAVIAGSIVIGMVGYHELGQLSWVESFENSTMLLGGMGQVGDVRPTSGKIFAGVYALYAGLVFIVLATTLVAPVFHRLLHRFHWQPETAETGSPSDGST